MYPRTITAMITPMFDNGKIDYAGFEQLLRFQYSNDITGFVVLGTTGEAPNVSNAERRHLIKLTVKTLKSFKSEATVIAGTGSANMMHAIEHTKMAADMGADAALVVTPYYIKPNKDGLIKYFNTLADIMPTIVYDIKGRTGRQIEIDEFKEIARHKNIIGIKAASGDIEQIKTVIKEVAEPIRRKREFHVWSGDDSLTVPVRKAGGYGVISVVSNLVPDKIRFIGTSANFASTEKIAMELQELIKAAFIENNPVAIKHMMWAAGLIKSNRVRLPLGQLQDENKKLVESVVAKYFKDAIR